MAAQTAPAPASARHFLVFANWKSSGTVGDVRDISRALAKTHWPAEAEAEVVVAPSTLHAHILEECLGAAARRVELGAQNVFHATGTHHTGEVTAEMLRDFGVRWVIVGHSDRRHDESIHETDELVAAKALHATGAGLRVCVCVGETAEERQQGRAVKVVTKQLQAVAEQLSHWENVAIAYEPVRADARAMAIQLGVDAATMPHSARRCGPSAPASSRRWRTYRRRVRCAARMALAQRTDGHARQHVCAHHADA